jgi:hypothetical protein
VNISRMNIKFYFFEFPCPFPDLFLFWLTYELVSKY